MSIRVMTWVWDNSPVGGSERLLLLAIADCANDEGGNAWPSIATLARKCRIDGRTVQRIIRRLADAGHLTVVASAGGRGSNVYTVVMGQGGQSSTPPADCHPRQGATGGTATPPHPRQAARAPLAQLRHPNVIEPSSNRSARERSTRRVRVPAATCARHIGQPADHCGPCRSETLAGVS